ncbi:hypothetical protein EP331_05335 [bacterium]|nr:MAG: hypothetical protein EP331_05335 [bacterium]
MKLTKVLCSLILLPFSLLDAQYQTADSLIKTEQFFLNLGGEEQYVEVLFSSKENPVLLFIHGGPTWPQTPQIRYFNSEIAEKYTLVIWEQRGSGKAYQKNIISKNLSIPQLVQNGLEL